MARPQQVLSFLSRLGALSPTNSCRFVSRGAVQWTGQSHVRKDQASNRALGVNGEKPGVDFEGYLEDLEDVDDKFQALVEKEKKRQKTVKYHILRRQMTPRGAPCRMLTWDAIEQIRYLKQEQPEEWTVERLAEGFSVTPDVILRVLRSKFVPPPQRKDKQDAKARKQVLSSGIGAVQDRLKLPGNNTAAMLLSGRTAGALISLPDQSLVSRGDGSRSLTRTPVPAHFTAGISKEAAVTRSTEESPTDIHSTQESTEEEDSWNGHVLTEEQLEEFMEIEKPPPLVQFGNDFFDAEGNFMYRI